MYFGAKPETFEAARILRKNMTIHEKLLWDKLDKKQICGSKFRIMKVDQPKWKGTL